MVTYTGGALLVCHRTCCRSESGSLNGVLSGLGHGICSFSWVEPPCSKTRRPAGLQLIRQPPLQSARRCNGKRPK
jgi:hypothetical protein